MRVIAGKYRSRLLAAPAGTETRPTSDRLRETLFNILAPRLEGCRFVDLYAGTGAVGIEALSRGAEHVFFAENAPAAVKALRANLARLGIAAGFAIEDRGTRALLERLLKLPAAVDLVYLDPPYTASAEYLGTLEWLGRHKAVRPDGLVVVEHASRPSFELPLATGSLNLVRSRRQGDTTLTFYSVAADGHGL